MVSSSKSGDSSGNEYPEKKRRNVDTNNQKTHLREQNMEEKIFESKNNISEPNLELENNTLQPERLRKFNEKMSGIRRVLLEK